LAWRIEVTAAAQKQLDRLGSVEARRITSFLRRKLAPLADPRGLGRPLSGPRLGSYWRYRVGNYRIICEIDDRAVRILVVQLGHRRDVYR
jgi:mRNA interferase RelE/StbE